MRFQNWLEEQNLLIEGVAYWTFYEAIEGEDLERLVLQAQQGRPDELLDRIQPLVRSIVARRIRGGWDNPDLEDLVQDINTSIIRNLQGDLGSPVAPEKFKGWLSKVAANAVVNHARRQRPTVSLGMEPETRDSPDDAGEKLDIVRKLIQELPEDEKELLQMMFFQGMKYDQIADQLGIPPGTAKSRMHYLKKKMRKALMGAGVDSE